MKMVKFAKIYLWILVAAVCLWQLPSWWNFLTADASSTPFVLYSALADDFVIKKTVDGKSVCELSDGSRIARKEYDSLLPDYFCRQLASENRLPDTILGRAVSLKYLNDENLSMRIKPEQIFGPQIPLYQLMESQSGRVDLEMPDDVFRMTETGIEFVRKIDNTIDEEKSQMFTQAFDSAYFNFPALEIASNLSEKKKYDNGFLLVDARNRIFNMKMAKGKPVIEKIELPHGIVPRHCFVTEFAGRHTLGLFFDKDNYLYAITLPAKETKKVDIPPLNLEDDEVLIMGNIFSWTIRVKNDKQIAWYAVDSQDFKLKKTYAVDQEDSSVKGLTFIKNDWVRLGWR